MVKQITQTTFKCKLGKGEVNKYQNIQPYQTSQKRSAKARKHDRQKRRVNVKPEDFKETFPDVEMEQASAEQFWEMHTYAA